MKVLSAPREFKSENRGVCAAIGVFDGVHLGHQQVIRQTLAEAEQNEAVAAVLTFNCHPSSVVMPEKAPLLIYSPEQKLRVIATLGVQVAIMLKFDRAFSEIPAETFIHDLAREWDLRSLSVGSGFTFGHRRKGNVELLQAMGADLGFKVHGLAAVALDGEKVSSTRIRKGIAAGQLESVAEMLGRPYTILSQVIEGAGIGRKLGYPTANLEVEGILLPPPGVYLAHARFDQHTHRAVINIGVRPTIQKASKPTLEAHLLDFNQNLYGQFLEIIPGDKLREEMKFGSMDELRQQIGRDIALALTRF